MRDRMRDEVRAEFETRLERESVRFDALASRLDYFMTAGAADMLRSALTTVNIFC